MVVIIDLAYRGVIIEVLIMLTNRGIHMADTPKAPAKRAPKAPTKRTKKVEESLIPQVETNAKTKVEEGSLPKIIKVLNAKGKSFTVSKDYYLANSHKLTIVKDA